MDERRLHPRLDLPLQADLVVVGDRYRATLENLSAGGAGIRVTEAVEAGSEIERFEFSLSAHKGGEELAVSTRATVVRSVPLEQPGGQGGYRLGLSFVDLPPDQFKGIQQFIYSNLTKGRPQSSEMPLDRRRVEVARPVSVRFDRFDKFVAEVSENISLGGMFIRTKKPQAPGSVFSFRFQLGDDFSLVEGRAEVVWTRDKDLGPRQRAGMGVRFLELDDSSRNVILRLIEQAPDEKKVDRPATGRFRVAAVFPKVSRKGRGAKGKSEESPAARKSRAKKPDASTTAEPDDRVETLRRELARRTRSYEERVGELEERIAELTSKRVDEVSDLRETKTSASEFESLNAVLEQRLQEVSTQLEHERTDLGTQLEEANQRLSELRQEVEASKKEQEASRQKRGSFENRLVTVEQALRHTERERDDLTARLKEGATARRELEAKLEAAKSGSPLAEDDDVKDELEEATNRLGVLSERLEAAESDRDEALGKLTLLSTTEASVRQTREQAEGERQELLAALGNAQNELARAQRDQKDRIAQLEEDLEQARADSADTGHVAEESEARIRDLESTLAAEGARVEETERLHQKVEAELREEVAQATQTAKNERRRAEEAEAARQEIESELAAIRNASQDADRERDEREAELREELRSAGSQASGRIEQLEASLENASRSRLELEEALVASEDELRRVEIERQSLEEGLRKEAREAVESATKLSERVEDLEDSLKSAEAQSLEVDARLEERDRAREQLEQVLAESRAEVDRLEQQSSVVEAELRGKTETALVTAAELQDRVDALEKALAEEERQRLAASGRTAEIEETLGAKIAALETREAELLLERDGAREETDAVRGDLDRERTEKSRVLEDVEEERGRRAALEAREAELIRERDEALAARSAVLEGVDKERQDKSRLLEDLDQERGRRAALETREAELIRERDEALAARSAVLEDVDKEREEKSRLLEDLDQERGGRSAFETREADLTGERDEALTAAFTAREEVKQERTEKSRLEASLEEERLRHASVERELEQAMAAATEREEQAKKSEESLRERSEALEESRSETREQASRIASRDEKIQALKDELGRRDADRESLVEELAALRSKVASLESAVADRGAERADRQLVAAASSEAETSVDSTRWIRAAGLVGVGLLAGALLMGPGSSVLPFGDGLPDWLTAREVSEATTSEIPSPAASPPVERVLEGLEASATPEGEDDPKAEGQVEPARVDETATAGVKLEAVDSYPAVEDVVRAWAEAWAGQRVEDYLWFYSSEFIPPNGAERGAWEAYRRERLEAPASIEITISNLRESSIDDEQTETVFEQAYSAGTYSDLVTKTLLMRREDGSWKIVNEQSVAVE